MTSPEFTELQLDKKLGDGSAAEVFLAHPPGSERPVVLKVLRAELTSDAELVGRFLDEAQVCQRLDHPGVVRHLDSGRLSDTRVFLMTEFLDGEDLRKRLRREGPLTVNQVLRLAAPLCEALAYVHEHGIVHRDLKPENIFLEGGLEAFRPKLLDFGLALFRGNKSVTTADGLLLATPEYTPPECVGGQKADARSDIYAFGILLYELVAGTPPFVSASYPDLLQMHLHAPPPPLPSHAQALTDIVFRCLAKAPRERFQNIRDVTFALSEIPLELEQFLTGGPGERAPAPHVLRTPSPVPTYPPVQEPLRALGSYEILSLLGEGAMGQVYLAQHTRLGKKVAIKVLKPEHARNRDLLERFFQEARTVNQINHEHIIEVHDFVDEVGVDGTHRAYCVMELLTGQTLAQILAEGPIAVSRVVRIVRQVCAGLGAAHRVGVVHRDVKPDNIFVSERSGVKDYVKLLDFGVAKLNTSFAPQQQRGGTLAGTIIGTPDYMSPEQSSGAHVDFRSDVYSVGVVLYEGLSLKRPFDAPAFGQLVVDINTKPVPPLPARTPRGEAIPRALQQLVMRCLEKNPEHRPESMEELAGELEASLRPPTGTLVAAPALVAGFQPLLDTAPVARTAPFNGRAAHFEPEEGDDMLAARLRPRRASYLVALLVGALLAAVGVYAWRSHRGSRGADVPRAPVAAQPLAAPAPVVPAPVPEVRFAVTSTPPGATVIRTDTGAVMGVTPLLLRTAPMKALPLKLTLAGWMPSERTLDAAEDGKAHFELGLVTARAKLEAAIPAVRPAHAKAHPTPHPRRAASARELPKETGRKEGVSRDGVIDPYANE